MKSKTFTAMQIIIVAKKYYSSDSMKRCDCW